MLKPLTLLALLIVTPSFASEILFLGDSLTAGYGVSRDESFVFLIQQKLKTEKPEFKIVNGAESGALSSSVFSRAQFYLKQNKPDLVVLTIGGNDARQGTAVQIIESNITKTIELLKQNKVKVLLVGMRIFPNLGPKYAKDFQDLYPRIAKKFQIPFFPFLLEGVAGHQELNQADGFHPNAQGHNVIYKNLYPALKKLL